jgi:glucose-6-phosphate isomerase
MESNGKSSDIYSNEINIDTSPIVFGQAGTDCQHSFFQMIHQGSQDIALDFIGVIDSNDNKVSSNFLISNLIAQANLCFYGKGSQKNNKKIRGNNPSNIILMNSVDPHSVGNLISMYEHKIFVEGILWNINSFDQWGVEEGKLLASKFINKINQSNRKDTDKIILQLLKTKF